MHVGSLSCVGANVELFLYREIYSLYSAVVSMPRQQQVAR